MLPALRRDRGAICGHAAVGGLETQTAPAPTATSAGRTPTGTSATTLALTRVDDRDGVGVHRHAVFAAGRGQDGGCRDGADRESCPHERGAPPAARRAAPRAAVGRLHLEESLAFGEALERDPSAVAQARVRHRARELPHSVGHEHLAATRALHHARGQVHRGPEQLAVALDHLACVEADPDLDAVLERGEIALDRQGACHGPAGGVEEHEEAVARRTDVATAVGGDLLAHDPVVLGEEATGGFVALARRQLRRRLDIGEHDGRDAARAL